MNESAESGQMIGGLRPEYKTYERQKCFIGHSRDAEWRDDILHACNETLPKFGLEPWYAADHFDPTKPLRDKVVELIANSRFGLYDISSWRDKSGEWHQSRNVFIELGIAIALNRPTLLIRHTSNQSLPLSPVLQGVELLEFAGETTLSTALERKLPQWMNVPPDRDWFNRFCIFGNRVCQFREEHPRAKQMGGKKLQGLLADGFDKDSPDFSKVEQSEIRSAFDDVFSRYADIDFSYLDEFPLVDSYQLALCSHCQAVRSTPFAVGRILPQTPIQVFIAIGISIALEELFDYKIPKVLLVRNEQDVPSLLRGYEVVESINIGQVKRKLKDFIPGVIRHVRETSWKPKALPFVEISIPLYAEVGESTQGHNALTVHGATSLGRVIAITSGSGGAGKTTITANLGVALAKQGQRVVLVDTNIGRRNLDVAMGLENRIVYDIADVAEGRARFFQVLIQDRRLPELYLLPASQTSETPSLNEKQMETLYEVLRKDFRFVLIDSPSGIEREFRNVIAPTDQAIIIVMPTISSVRDADRVIGIIESMEKTNLRLLVNRLRPEMVERGDMMDTSDVLEILAIELIGTVKEDDAIVASVNRGQPVAFEDTSGSGAAFTRIAQRLLGEDIPFE